MRKIKDNNMAESLTASEEKLMAYLTARIETAGRRNNLKEDNPFEWLNGLITAISDESEVLESEVDALSHQVNVPAEVVETSIEKALDIIYHKYAD